MLVSIDKIEVGDRHRRDLGDISELADSIAHLGMLQPIGVTSDMTLVFGERRLSACRDVLGQTEIEVRTVDVPSIMEGEFAENEIRKAFTPSERVAIADAIKEQLGNSRGKRTDVEHGKNITQVRRPRNSDIAAKKAGFGNRVTYTQAKKVIEHAVPELVAAMDSGEVSISAAAKVAERPKLDQRQYLETSEYEKRRNRKVRRNGEASRTAHEKIMSVSLHLEEIANTTVTAAEYRALALPYTLKVTRERAVTVMAFLTEILKDEEYDTTRAREVADSHASTH